MDQASGSGRAVVLALVIGIALAGAAAPSAAQSDRAEKTLAKWRAQALEAASRDITSRNLEKRRQAAEELGRFDEASGQVVPLLAAALSDDDAIVREKAASSLWELGEAAAAAQGALRGVLDDSSPAVRVRAAGALEAAGADPAELVPARRSVVAEGDWFDRALAIRDLIGHVDAAELAEPLVRAIRDTPPSVRDEDPEERFSGVAVLRPLAATGSRAVIPPLMAALAEPVMPHAELVAALSQLDPEPEGWVEALVRVSRDPDPDAREAVGNALELRARRPDGGAGWPEQVLHLLSDGDRDVRWQAVTALGAAGGHAHAAASGIARIAAGYSDVDLRTAAVRALGSMGDRSEPFDREVKAGIAEVAGPALLAVVDDTSLPDDLRRDAMEAYVGLVLEPQVAVRELSRIAGGAYPDWVRIVATRGFWPLGRAAEPALPLLERLTADPETLVASAASSAIDDIRRGVAVAPAAPAAPAGGGAGAAAAEAWLRQNGQSFDHDGFYRAMAEGRADAVERYLEAGMSAADAGTTGMPPLHMAVATGCPWGQPTPEETGRMVAALLAHGADPEAADEQGNRALHRAVGSCDRSVISRLVEAGADLGAANAVGMTPFALALVTNPGAAEVLVEAGYRVTPEQASVFAQWVAGDPAKQSVLDRAQAR